MGKIITRILFPVFCIGNLLSGCTSDYCQNLGHGYVFCNEGTDYKYIYHKHSVGGEIPPTILEYKKNKDFIIVKQKPRTRQKIDSIAYFIIFKNMERIDGPYTFKQFMKETDKHKIDLTFVNSTIEYN